MLIKRSSSYLSNRSWNLILSFKYPNTCVTVVCVFKVARLAAAAEDDAEHHHGVSLNVVKLIIKWHVTAKKIDRVSRYVFPISFLVFNIIYWLRYTVF